MAQPKKLTIKDCTCATPGKGGNLSCPYCHPVPLEGAVLGTAMSLASRGMPAATRPSDDAKKKEEKGS